MKIARSNIDRVLSFCIKLLWTLEHCMEHGARTMDAWKPWLICHMCTPEIEKERKEKKETVSNGKIWLPDPIAHRPNESSLISAHCILNCIPNGWFGHKCVLEVVVNTWARVQYSCGYDLFMHLAVLIGAFVSKRNKIESRSANFVRITADLPIITKYDR